MDSEGPVSGTWGVERVFFEYLVGDSCLDDCELSS